jgi:DNA (cytosine-5)-methyltransferase 1
VTKAYYNEIDPKAAQWLKNLIACGEIANGDVDTRSIEDVKPDDLKGYTQCHFFAGIGGWSYALRLAGWPDDRPVWTGSCPCQPFSAAGKGKGFADERHLWPAWLWLTRQRRPSVIFGEQVANAVQWIDLVQGDLEAEGYFVGYTVLGAHSVGAPHVRQRFYWMADTVQSRREGLHSYKQVSSRQAAPQSLDSGPFIDSRRALLGDTKSLRIDNGVSGRVGLVRGYGNAIVPQVAQAFIEAYLDG